MAFIHSVFHNEVMVFFIMAVVIFLLTQLIKQPVKALTKKIKNETTRKRVNAVILLIPFVLGVVIDFFYSTFYLHTAFIAINGLGWGTASISLYSIIERIFQVENPYNTEQGKKAVTLIDKISQDGKVDGNDVSAVKDYINKLNE